MMKRKWNSLVAFGLIFSVPVMAEVGTDYDSVSTGQTYSQSELEVSDFEPSTNYLAPAIKVTDLRNSAGILVGALAAIYTSPGFEIGIGGFALANNVAGSSSNNSLQFGYGGLTAGFRLFPYNPVSLVLGSLVGVGGSNLAVTDFRGAFIVLEPEAKLQVTFSPLFQLSLGGGYRFLPRTNNTGGIRLSNLSGVVGTLAFQFSGI